MKPISYLQTDKRWSNVNYSAKGESTTIGKAGCGPTCMAMVLATLVDRNITPITTANWSLQHGYKACKQGTYYSYFTPQGKTYGINVARLNNSNIYKNNLSGARKARERVKKELSNGNWIIACMGKGTWTSSGHYVLAYGLEGGKVLINDPNSTKTARIKGDMNTFLNEAKFFWLIEVDEEMVDTTKMIVNGKEVNVERILKDGTNYVRLRDFDDKLGICTVGYDEDKKIPTIQTVKPARKKATTKVAE